jgi:hypothetical protein
MAHWLSRLASLPGGRRALLVEAVGALLAAQLRVRCLPFRRVAARLGASGAETGHELTPAQQLLSREVEWAIAAASRRLRPRPTCLMEAVAAQALLRRRGVASTVYLGVAPARADGRQINAHAWLRCGERIVTGKTEAGRFRALACFS